MSGQFMLYKNRAVQVEPIPRDRFERIYLDAERIMGLAPVLNRQNVYLDPPSENDIAYTYATYILGLRWPVAYIWLGYYKLVSLHDLEALT